MQHSSSPEPHAEGCPPLWRKIASVTALLVLGALVFVAIALDSLWLAVASLFLAAFVRAVIIRPRLPISPSALRGAPYLVLLFFCGCIVALFAYVSYRP